VAAQPDATPTASTSSPTREFMRRTVGWVALVGKVRRHRISRQDNMFGNQGFPPP